MGFYQGNSFGQAKASTDFYKDLYFFVLINAILNKLNCEISFIFC